MHTRVRRVLYSFQSVKFCGRAKWNQIKGVENWNDTHSRPELLIFCVFNTSLRSLPNLLLARIMFESAVRLRGWMNLAVLSLGGNSARPLAARESRLERGTQRKKVVRRMNFRSSGHRIGGFSKRKQKFQMYWERCYYFVWSWKISGGFLQVWRAGKWLLVLRGALFSVSALRAN